MRESVSLTHKGVFSVAKMIESVASRAKTPFKNEALTDFTRPENRQAQGEALEQVKSELGQTYPLIIGGEKIFNKETFASVNPSQPDQVIGYFARASVEQADEAVKAAAAAFETWKRVPAEERAGYLFAAADLLKQRRFYVNAWMIYEVGMTAGVVNFLTGSGSVIGDALIEHPMVRFIAFTGSRDVGLRINQLAAKPYKGQLWLKRAVLEMGGKDAVVVDETADLDAAAGGIVASAFGFQGQKCSAGSRAIIVGQVYDQVLQKVIEKTKKLTMGDVTQPETYMGPVVDENAMKKITEYIEIGKTEGRLVAGGDHHGPGYFIEPTVIADVDPHARIAQEEIFGPVLAVIKAKDFDDALHIANDTEYGLTGSLYSQDAQRIERAKQEYHVGNLYFNRKSTGALVGVHPFGGFNMSGTDSKAGGRDYLLLFTQAKAISAKKA